MFEIIIIVAIMKLCLFNSIQLSDYKDKLYICKYIFFMKKQEATETFKMLEHVEAKT